MLDLLDELAHRHLADVVLGYVDGRERGEHDRGDGQVVEADERDVLGHAVARLDEGAHGAAGEHVVLGEERRRELGLGADPLLGVRVGGADGRAQGDAELLVEGEPGLVERQAAPALAQGEVADLRLALDVADLAVALLDEVVHGVVGGVLVGDHDRLHEAVLAPAVDHDEGRGGVVEGLVVLLVHLGAEKDDASGRVAAHVPHAPHGSGVGEVDGDVGGRQPVLLGLPLDAVDDGGVEVALVEDLAALAGDDELDAVEARGALVAKLLRGLQDDLCSLLADAALAVERVGDRGGREPRLAADVPNSDLQNLSPLFTKYQGYLFT